MIRATLFVSLLLCTSCVEGASAGPIALSPSSGKAFEIRTWREGAATGELWIATFPAGSRLSVQPAPATPTPLAKFVVEPQEKDFAAVNGGFYSDAPMGLVLSSGRELHRRTGNGGSGVFFVANGLPGIAASRGFLPPAGTSDALQSIDRLVHAGKSVVKRGAERHADARTAVAIDAAGATLLLVLFDSRAAQSRQGGVVQLGPGSSGTGPSLFDFAELLARPVDKGGLGAAFALNLDGGYSSSMKLRFEGETREIRAFRGTVNAVVGVRR